MATVTITAAPLSLDELIAVVDGAAVVLAEPVRTRIAAARTVVDRALAEEAAVYGLTTHVGHGKDTRLTPAELRSGQLALIMSHAGGLGEPLDVRRVRAALVARLNGIARAGSGASPAVADVLVALLNRGVHPVMPTTGSVGAADLGQLAFMAQVAVGRGRAEYRGETLAGAEALARAGIEPLVLSGKDGLALISSNAVSIGHAALVVARAERASRLADLAAALAMEATGANPSILHPEVGLATGMTGQQEAAHHLRRLLTGGSLLDPETAHSVQNALSFRVVPQVHGAFRHLTSAFAEAVTQELNAASDNPLVVVAEQKLISNGNFQPMIMAILADALRVAVAHVAQLSEHRLAHLWNAYFARLSAGAPAGEAIGLALRYSGAAVYAELRHLAGPATLDVPALDLGVEDHAANAPLTVQRADRALGLLEDLLVIEILLARDVLSGRNDVRLGQVTQAMLQLVDRTVAAAGPAADAVHRAVKRALVPDEVGREP